MWCSCSISTNAQSFQIYKYTRVCEAALSYPPPMLDAIILPFAACPPFCSLSPRGPALHTARYELGEIASEIFLFPHSSRTECTVVPLLSRSPPSPGPSSPMLLRPPFSELSLLPRLPQQRRSPFSPVSLCSSSARFLDDNGLDFPSGEAASVLLGLTLRSIEPLDRRFTNLRVLREVRQAISQIPGVAWRTKRFMHTVFILSYTQLSCTERAGI